MPSTDPPRRLNIAIAGTRGIPANYGGFETFAEHLSTRLVERGHRVTVYGRSHYIRQRGYYRGVRLVVLPTWRSKYTDTAVHSFLSVLHAWTQPFDLLLVCNAANAIFCLAPRLRGQRIVLNVDGIERERAKWNIFGKFHYALSERLAIRLADTVVADARVIQQYFARTYNFDAEFIPYGAATEPSSGTAALEQLGVFPRRYFLYVSRLEPENNAHRVIEAYAQVRSEFPLVLVGSAPYSRDYIAQLHAAADRRMLFAGAVYGQAYRELISHALAYIHATEVGGTHPALIEAMGVGNLVVANDTVENREVVADSGLLYRRNDSGDLARILQEIVADPSRFSHLPSLAQERVRVHYNWEAVVDQYEELFWKLV